MFEGEICIFLSGLSRAVFLCSDLVRATKILKGLQSLNFKCEILISARDNKDVNDKNLKSIALAISKFCNKELDFLICLSVTALLKFDKKSLTQKFEMITGHSYKIEQVISTLAEYGYERVESVTNSGEFALRGDIIDVYPYDCDNPVRFDFFDENIEKINFFDIFSMNLGEKIEKFSFYPSCLKLGKDDIFSLSENFIVDEQQAINRDFSLLEKEQGLNVDIAGTLNSRANYFFNNLDFADFDNRIIGTKSYVRDFLSLEKDIKFYLQKGISVVLFGGEKSYILENFLRENKITFLDFSQYERGQKCLYISKIAFPFSFSFLKSDIIAIGLEDLFSISVDYKKVSKKKQVMFLPKINDYVVHEFYGIGRCIAIEKLKVASDEKDYFIIEYKNNSKLYLPTSEANLITLYSGGDAEPKLSSLGTGEFEKIKQKVKAKLKEISGELAKVYNLRMSKSGFAFKKDITLENAFDKAFKYELTIDQAQAIADVENDMMSSKIMDRLICGDVGFGKTEVAMRASFKAVLNAKQVLVLCPTTILSMQHYLTFKERMKDFDIRIEVLNRFKTQAETTKIINRLKNGEIDILIGTHKALSDNVKFHDLGLLVLDEEQRFGVLDKEKIKKIKTDVDVLSMSATPIPRTLHMALSGIRDISIIATPPKQRLPIQTYIAPFDDEILKKALDREMIRRGKAFVIYNRVQGIMQVAEHIKELMKGARVGVAHGQMTPNELENVIAKLFNNEFNILVSTTLIENGVDLPSANTLFVIDADNLGLSQLYQLRGRIGRSDKLAYAYLTYNPGKVLTTDAVKRLEAINEFRELGSGFKIAMRDLEIRGAGNILGKEQHGHMLKVGYELYMKLLSQVLAEAKNEEVKDTKIVKMTVAVSAFISEDFVKNDDERIKFYSQISEIENEKMYKQVCLSFKSAYGRLPKETDNLCKIAFVKNLASVYPIKEIVINQDRYEIILERGEDYNSVLKLFSDFTLSLKNSQLPTLIKQDKNRAEDKLNVLIKKFTAK